MEEVSRRVGRRGAYLLASSVLYALYGAGLALWPAGREVPSVYAGLTSVLPMRMWGWVWVTAAVVCVVTAFARRDAIGFTVLTLMAGMWAVGTLLGAWMGDEDRAFVIGLLFATMAVLHLIVSGMEERRGAPV